MWIGYSDNEQKYYIENIIIILHNENTKIKYINHYPLKSIEGAVLLYPFHVERKFRCLIFLLL